MTVDYNKLDALINYTQLENIKSREQMLKEVVVLGQPPARLVEFRRNRALRAAKRDELRRKPKRKHWKQLERNARLRRKRRTLRYKSDPRIQYAEWKRKLLAKGDEVDLTEDEYVKLVEGKKLTYKLTRLDTRARWWLGNIIVVE